MAKLYRGFATQAEIDAQYDVERSVPDFSVYARHFTDESRVARHRLRGELDLPYGPTRAETLDVFPAEGRGRARVRLHPRRLLAHAELEGVQLRRARPGGARHHHRRRQLRAGAEGVDRRDRAADACRRRLVVIRRIDRYGGDPSRVAVGGHSAGAHLTAMCLQTAWHDDYGLPNDDPLAAAVARQRPLRPRAAALQPDAADDPARRRRHPPLLADAFGTAVQDAGARHLGRRRARRIPSPVR